MGYKLVGISIVFFLEVLFSFSPDSGFFTESHGARSAAIGGIRSLDEDGSNPKRLYSLQSPYISFGIGDLYSGLARTNYVSSFVYKNDIPFYWGVFTRSVSNIPDTRNAWLDDGNSLPEASEINYLNISMVHQREIGIKVAATKSWNKLYISTVIKPHFMNLADYERYGFSIDLNGSFQLKKYTTLLGKVENIIGGYVWDSGKSESNTPRVVLGSLFQYGRFTLAGETSSHIPSDEWIYHSVGTEIFLQPNLIIRVGKNNRTRFTAGLGIRLPLIQVDYAFIQPEEKLPFEASQFFTLSFFTKELRRIKGKVAP